MKDAQTPTTTRDAFADDMWKRIMGDPALAETCRKLSIDNLRTIITHAVDATTVQLDAAEARYQSAVKGRKEFRQAYRESRITENYNDSREDVDRFNERTGGGVW